MLPVRGDGISHMDQLTDLIAKIANIPPDTIAPEKNLRALGLTNSIMLWQLQHALERAYSQKLAALSQDLTIGEIASQIGSTSSEGERQPEDRLLDSTAQQLPAMSSGSLAVGIGVDLEEVGSLPEAKDYRDDSFYQEVFAPRELSHAILQSNPRETLCGFFCAKEALKKTHPALVNLPMSEIQVSHEKGKPYIRVLSREIDQQFHFQVSISHTSRYATAVVLAFLR